ncbi:Regulatory protein NPR1 [Platanthera guangdongensis]|uniref:Regulatory protein NPR1 n=1 Tax=Platanthera guangdongensis TaxID=2320717 RepID=A0ABR2M149_9ASPA
MLGYGYSYGKENAISAMIFDVLGGNRESPHIPSRRTDWASPVRLRSGRDRTNWEFSSAHTNSPSFAKQTPATDCHELGGFPSAVEVGKSFFPRCSAVLDKIMDDDLTDFASFGSSASSEHMKTYLELLDIVNRAFSADKEKLGKSALSPASSVTSAGPARKRSRVRA